MHNCYMEKILSDGNKEEMEELRKVFDKAMYKLKELDKDEYDHLELWLYKTAYGKVLNEDMARNIIMKMQPYGMHWTLEQTKEVQAENGLSSIRPCEFWAVMNMAYNDYHDIFDDNLEMYVKYAKDFIEDEDAKEGKVFTYFTQIPK